MKFFEFIKAYGLAIALSNNKNEDEAITEKFFHTFDWYIHLPPYFLHR